MKKIYLSLLLIGDLAYGIDIGGLAQSALSQSSGLSTPTNSSAGAGLSNTTTALGQNGGYLNNKLVKIPLPGNLAKAETMIRQAGGDKIADNLIQSMNEAASKAAPKTTDIFLKALDNMSIDDAKNILGGGKDAATQYFKTHTTDSLQKTIAPIVQESMKESNVGKYYDSYNGYYQKYGQKYLENDKVTALSKSFGADSYLPSSKNQDINSYVTQKAIDGLFAMIGQKEATIRANPLGQTSSLLKEVFGSVK